MARNNLAVRWGTALVAMGLMGVLLSPAPAAAARQLRTDSVTGTGSAFFWGNFQIDATSEANGESPSGTVAVAGVLSFDGPVTCLSVQANLATLNIQTVAFGLVTMTLTDNAMFGIPDVIEAAPIGRLPTDCSSIRPGSGTITTTVDSGDIVVVDATTRKPPKPDRDKINDQVSGPFEGTQSFEFGGEGCPFLFQVFDLQYAAEAGGTGTIHLEGCIDESFGYHPELTLTTPSGAVLRGTATGTSLPFRLMLEVTSTEDQQFRKVEGVIALTGGWSGFPEGPGTASGDLVGDLRKAKP